MNARQFDYVIQRYLNQVRDRLGDLPEANRAEIIEDLRAHIEDAIRDSGATTEADVRNVLERLGDPDELAREARERVNGERTTQSPVYRRVKASPGVLEIAAIILTAIVWPIGLLLAWVSSRWRTRDKVIATVIPFFAFFFMLSMLLPLGLVGTQAIQSYQTSYPVAVPVSPSPGVDLPSRLANEVRDTAMYGMPRGLFEMAGRVLAMFSFIFGLLGAPFVSAIYLAIRVRPAEETIYPDGTRVERELTANGAA